MSDPTQPSAPDFASRDPNSPEFWDERFERQFMPWDQAGVPPEFQSFASRHSGAAVLIPGCGSAYEALWLAEHGNPVRAIDFSGSLREGESGAARRQGGRRESAAAEHAAGDRLRSGLAARHRGVG